VDKETYGRLGGHDEKDIEENVWGEITWDCREVMLN
jgi:hypothetical protein